MYWEVRGPKCVRTHAVLRQAYEEKVGYCVYSRQHVCVVHQDQVSFFNFTALCLAGLHCVC